MSTTGGMVGRVREHRCDHCGAVAPFGPGWRWVEAGDATKYIDKATQQSACSDACEAKLRTVPPPSIARCAP